MLLQWSFFRLKVEPKGRAGGSLRIMSKGWEGGSLIVVSEGRVGVLINFSFTFLIIIQFNYSLSNQIITKIGSLIKVNNYFTLRRMLNATAILKY